jgi:hypothetical protein
MPTFRWPSATSSRTERCAIPILESARSRRASTSPTERKVTGAPTGRTSVAVSDARERPITSVRLHRASAPPRRRLDGHGTERRHCNVFANVTRLTALTSRPRTGSECSRASRRQASRNVAGQAGRRPGWPRMDRSGRAICRALAIPSLDARRPARLPLSDVLPLADAVSMWERSLKAADSRPRR